MTYIKIHCMKEDKSREDKSRGRQVWRLFGVQAIGMVPQELSPPGMGQVWPCAGTELPEHHVNLVHLKQLEADKAF